MITRAEVERGHSQRECLCGAEHFQEDLADGRVRLDPRDPSTARHAPQCEHRDTTDTAIHRAIPRVQDRDGYWMECSTCDSGRQVAYYAAENAG